MSKTSIEWTQHTINPIRARNKATGKVGHFCVKVSPGCANCYASTWNEERFGTGLPFIDQYRDSVELFLDESKLQEVLRRKKPTTYFWCDMTDMFYEGHPEEWIDKCFAAMALTPWHTHQVLTKRTERMATYLGSGPLHNSLELAADQLCPGQGQPCFGGKHMLPSMPFKNVWLGVSVENQQRADERIPHLLNTPAAVRFLSCEPLLGHVDLDAMEVGCGWRPLWCSCSAPGCNHTKVDWVIIGGESGDYARPCHIENVRSLVQQCKAAGVACFVKQLGSNCLERMPDAPVYVELLAGVQSGTPEVYKKLKLKHPKGGDPSEWPEDLRVREFPKGL